MSFLRGRIWGACFILTIALLSSCRSLKNTNTLFQSEYDKFADTAKSVYVANGNRDNNVTYKLQPYDLISIKNLQNPEGLGAVSITEATGSAVFRIDKDGELTLPVIGRIKVSEMTQAEAAAAIQKLYAKTLLKDPIIELILVNNTVILLGEIAKPGMYALERENVDLLEMIGKSGGFIPSSDARRIKIIRGPRDNPEVIFVNLKNLNSLASKKLTVTNRDIIYVPPKNISNISEGFRNYLTVIQPALLVFNALILIATLKNL